MKKSMLSKFYLALVCGALVCGAKPLPATLPTNAGTITNTGVGVVNGNNGLENQSGGLVENSGTLANNEELLNDSGAAVNNSYQNAGGTLSNTAGAEIVNSSGGSLANGESGEIANESGALVDNSGTLTNGVEDAGYAEFDNYGTLTNESTGVITEYSGYNLADAHFGGLYNEGTLTNDGTINNDVYGYLSNTATLTNKGTINNENNSEIDNSGLITNAGTGVVDNSGESSFYNFADGTLTAEAGGVIDNNGAYLENDGFLDNFGTLSNTAAGTVHNNGQLTDENGGVIGNAVTSSSTFYNFSDGTVTAEAGGVINNGAYLQNYGFLDNFGALSNTVGAEVQNYGQITDESGGAFYNDGAFYNLVGGTLTAEAGGAINTVVYFENDGFLDNFGALSNTTATRNTTAMFANYGRLTNESGGVIGNDGDFYNYGTLSNMAGSLIANKGQLTNAVGGIIENLGSMGNTSSGMLSNYGQITGGFGVDVIWNKGEILNGITGVVSYIGTLDNRGLILNLGLVNSGDPDPVIGAHLVNNGGTVDNYGSISAADLSNENGGTVYNAGTLNLSGDYSQDSSSRLVVEVAPKGVSTVNVGGSADVNGTLQLVFAPGVYSDRSYTLLNAAGGVSGSFTTVTQSSPYANGTVDYGPDLVALGIQSFEVSPDNDSVYGDLGNLALLQADQANSSLLRRLDGLSSGLGVEGANLLANPTTDSGRRTGAWERNSGYSYRINQDGPVAGYYAQGGGITAGMDQRWGKALGGFSVGDGSTDLTLADGESGTIGSPNANLYGALDLGVVDLGASVGYAYDSFSATRPITSVMQTASGSYTGQEESGAIQAGIPLSAGGVALLPKAGVEYAHLSDAGFTESGATVFDLAVAGHDSNSLRPFLGLTLNKGFVLGAWRFCPNVDMGWSYETMNEGLQGTATAGGESFTLAGQTPAPGEFSAGGGFSAQVAGDFSLNTDYQTLLPIGNAREQTLSIGLRYQFGAAAPGSLVPAGN